MKCYLKYCMTLHNTIQYKQFSVLYKKDAKLPRVLSLLPWFYSCLARLPGIRLVHPVWQQFKYLQYGRQDLN